MAVGATNATIDADDVAAGSMWKFSYQVRSLDTSIATVAIATTNVITITGVAAGETEIELAVNWFGGPDKVLIPVTVT